MTRGLFLLAIFNLVSGAVDVYLGSLAEKIQKEGLVEDFPQSWTNHLSLWQKFSQKAQNENGNYAFSCNTTKGATGISDSIDNLHPADIEIIGAMGDSFTAGSGANASRYLEASLQYRGQAFPIGGDGNFTTVETLPNILKEYNSKIIGWSRSIGPFWFEELSALNVAVPEATASDLEDQANELIRRINQIPGARGKWKLITIFIGINDLCDGCDRSGPFGAALYGRRVGTAIEQLRNRLTRTFINVIALPPLFSWYRQLRNDPICNAFYRFLCPCSMRPTVDNQASQYNAELYQLQDYSRRDFAVVVQPFLSGQVQFPNKFVDGSNRIDQSIFSVDCFHFSRRGHAEAARALWTNMFQPVGEKGNTLEFSQNLTCPNERCPYFQTWKNGDECGRQSTIRQSHPTLPPEIANYTDVLFNFSTYFTSTPSKHHSVENSPASTSIHHHSFPTAFPLNFTVTPPPWWTAVFGNFSRHFWNVTIQPIHNLRALEVDQDSNASMTTATMAWIALAVVLSLVVVGALLASATYWHKRQRLLGQTNERTPLLQDSNAEKIF